MPSLPYVSSGVLGKSFSASSLLELVVISVMLPGSGVGIEPTQQEARGQRNVNIRLFWC